MAMVMLKTASKFHVISALGILKSSCQSHENALDDPHGKRMFFVLLDAYGCSAAVDNGVASLMGKGASPMVVHLKRGIWF